MAKHTSLRARFLGFAGGHFALSALVVVVVFAVVSSGADWDAAVTAVLMLLYVPTGAFTAWLMEWERPTAWEWLRAVALTGGVACLWGFGGFFLCFVEPLAMVGFTVLMSTAFLASPSFCLMFMVTIGILDFHGLTWAPVWFGSIAAAALLPPVLFFTGALFVKKKQPQMGLDEGRTTL